MESVRSLSAAGSDDARRGRLRSAAAPTLGGLFALAWPIIVSRSSQVVIGFTDALMVAPLGEAALAATTAGALNAYALLILPMGIVFIVAGLGTTSLAGMMAVLQINSVAFMPGFALASAGAILVGQAIGSAAKDKVPAIVRLTFLTAATWQGIVGLAYLLVPGLLFAPFAHSGEEGEALRAVGTRLLMLSAAWQLFDSAATTLAEALRAAGDTAFTLWARLVLAWAFFAPGAYFTVTTFGGGDVGAVLWLVAYLALLALALWARFRSGAWRNFRLTERIA